MRVNCEVIGYLQVKMRLLLALRRNPCSLLLLCRGLGVAPTKQCERPPFTHFFPTKSERCCLTISTSSFFVPDTSYDSM